MHRKIQRVLVLAALIGFCAIAPLVRAQSDGTVVEDTVAISKAQVVSVDSDVDDTLPGIGTPSFVQMLTVRVLDGAEKGETLPLRNDYIRLRAGQKFYLSHVTNALDGTDRYAVYDVDRLPAVLFFVGLFVLCVMLFGGFQGLRGIVSLAVSLFAILYLLLPGILHGYSPLLLSLGVSSVIIVLGSYVTHGFNRTTSSAVFGMIATVVITGLLAVLAVHMTQLTGFSNEEAVYLNYNTQGSINFIGLLLGGIMIGLLGVLYDVAIGQAVSVEELHRAGPHLPRAYVYKRAIRIGREHIGALVNTLAIAYVGASLPLLLLFYGSGQSVALTANKEIFATEIVRTMIGSIGLVLAVPITTFIAVFLLLKVRKGDATVIEHEKALAARVGHPP